MEQKTPTTKDLAALVLSTERADASDPDDLQSATQRIFETLSAHLSIRLGSRGYRALLKRAVTLAAADSPVALASIHVSEPGTMEGFGSLIEASMVTDACVAILARLIELLDTFIGRNLTVRVLNNMWPNILHVDAADRPGESIG